MTLRRGRVANRPCAYVGEDGPCPIVVRGYAGSRCATHDAEVKRGYKDKPWRFVYSTPRWKGLRRVVLHDNPFCAVEGCHNMASDVDHVIPLSELWPDCDPYDRANVQGLCKMHHSRKTAQETWGRK